MNLDCLPACASSARAGFHSITKRGESMFKVIEKQNQFITHATYRGFDIVYDDSIIAHLRGWYYIPATGARAFSMQGAKQQITKYINKNRAQFESVKSNNLNNCMQAYESIHNKTGATIAIIIEVVQDTYCIFDIKKMQFIENATGARFFDIDCAVKFAHEYAQQQ